MAYIGNKPAELAVDIDNASVTTEKLANDAVTAAKIVDGTIIADDLNNGIITNSKVASNAAIAATKLAVSGGSNITLQSDGTFDLDNTIDITGAYQQNGTNVITSSGGFRVPNGQDLQIGNAASNTGKLQIYLGNTTAYRLDVFGSTAAREVLFQGSSSGGKYNFRFKNEGSGGADLDISNGGLQIGGSTTIDSSRNATFTGVDITGTATITETGNNNTLTLSSTDADANAGPNLLMFRESASPADSDRLATITYRGKNDAAENVDYVVYDSFISDASNGSEDATLDIRTIRAGSEVSRIALTPVETVINESSNNLDFRVESDTNTHAIFLNAGDGRLGLFTGSPLVKFQIGDFGSNTSKSGQAALVESGGFNLNFDTGGNTAGSTHRINFIDRHGAASQGTDGQIGAYIEAARDGSSSNINLNLGAVNNNAGDAGELMSITANNGIINKTYSVIEMTAPQLIFNRTDRGTDLKKWRLAHSSEHLEIQALNDAESAAYSAMKFERTATGTTTTIVNPDSRTVGDFQVKSASNANMLFVNAGTNRIGMGTSNPTGSLHLLDVTDSGGSDVFYVAQNTTANRVSGYRVFDESSNLTAVLQYDNGSKTSILNLSPPSVGNADIRFDGTTFEISSNSSGAKLQLQSNSTDRLTFYATGEVVFNEPGNDYDFRVESVNNTHAFYIDGANGAKYFGTGTNQGTTGAGTFNILVQGGDAVNLRHLVDGNHLMNLNQDGTTTYNAIYFSKNGVGQGAIQVSTTGITYNTTSDRRLKTDIQPIADATDKLMAMNPVTHKWKADPDADAIHGFIAQEMQEIVPEAVSGDPDGEEMMSMDYGRITPVLVAALQDAMKEITALKERVAELEAK